MVVVVVTMAQTRRILYDLALTIEVHPIALGVIPESNGQVTMPEQVVIHADGTGGDAGGQR